MIKLKKERVYSLLIFLIIIVNLNFIVAQPYVEIFNSRYSFFPPTTYSLNSNASLTTHQLTTELFLPVQFKNGDAIICGAFSDYIQLNYRDPGKEVKVSLYSESIRLGYLKVLGKKNKWDGMVILLPKINSDLIDVSEKDFQLGGLLLFTFKKNSSLKYKFGWYFNNEYFNPYTFPIVGIDWQVNKKLRLFGNLPIDFTAEYKLGNRIYSGFKFNPLTYSYRLNEKLLDSYVKQVDYQMKFFCSYYLTSNVALNLECGHTIGRYYRQFNTNNDLMETNPIYGKFDDSAFFNFGLAFRVWTEQDKNPLPRK